MTQKSLRLVAELLSILLILLATALECNSFSQSQFNLYFLLIFIILCLSEFLY